MLAVTSCEKSSARLWKAAYRPYQNRLRSHDPVKLNAQTGGRTATLGESVSLPKHDHYYLLDGKSLLAISHAIEDMALDQAEGELIASFQHFANFIPEKKRYRELAQYLQSVRVWGAGSKPRDCAKIDFISTHDTDTKHYRLVLYQGPEVQAMMLAKQVCEGSVWPHQHFVGFYTFNPYLIQSIRWRFNLLNCGLKGVVDHWEKQYLLPTVSPREIQKHLR